MATKKLTQAATISHLAEETGLRIVDVKRLFVELTQLAEIEVKKNGEFKIPGFGKLVKTTRKAREGRNPATGTTIRIPAKTNLTFVLAKTMKAAVGLPDDPTNPKDPER
ncbi:MAG: HU family DNA-binding protein [Pyrinomonadaceae bacterium]